ncbi:MAG: hypothetical protein ACM3PT_07590 [Deltaproteobacteria bacterium]
MAITYDKKAFKSIEKSFKTGKKKYILRHSILSSFFFAGTIVFIKYYFWHEDNNFSNLILRFFIYFLIWFLLSFFIVSPAVWNDIERTYNDTKEYWTKHDPSFFDEEKFEKID